MPPILPCGFHSASVLAADSLLGCCPLSFTCELLFFLISHNNHESYHLLTTCHMPGTFPWVMSLHPPDNLTGRCHNPASWASPLRPSMKPWPHTQEKQSGNLNLGPYRSRAQAPRGREPVPPCCWLIFPCLAQGECLVSVPCVKPQARCCVCLPCLTSETPREGAGNHSQEADLGEYRRPGVRGARLPDTPLAQ